MPSRKTPPPDPRAVKRDATKLATLGFPAKPAKAAPAAKKGRK